MDNSERKITARRNWLRIYEETGSVTKTALRCGIARSTLYKWIKRRKEDSRSELSDKSHRPKTLTNKKITPELETLILDTRYKRKISADFENKTGRIDIVADFRQTLCIFALDNKKLP